MATTKKVIPLHHHRRSLRLPQIALIVIVLIVLYVIASSIIFNPVHQLSGQEYFTLGTNNTMFYSLPDNSTLKYAIFLKNSSNSSATFYVTQLPVLTKPIIVVTLLPGGSANVSGKATGVADVHIELSSSTKSKASFSLTPLLEGLSIKVTGNIQVQNPSSFSGNVSTSTIQTTASTSISTTTVVTLNATEQTMLAINATDLGMLLSKYKAIYIKNKQCTPSVYNSTYTSKFGSAPPAPNSFKNVSARTPTDLTIKVSGIGSNTFNVTYSSVSPSTQTTGEAVVIKYSLTTNSTLSESFKGIYAGQNYIQLNTTYNFFNSFNNDCGAYIP